MLQTPVPLEFAVSPAAPSIPHSRQAEEAVIGAVLINPETFHPCRVELPDGAEEFYIHHLRWIWETFERLTKSGLPIDLLTVSDSLEAVSQLAEVGGPAYLTSLVNASPTSLNAHAHARLVHGYYIRRRMVTAANKIASIAYDTETPIVSAAATATHELVQAVATTERGHMISMAEAVKEADAISEENSKYSEDPGIPTPLIDLNRILGGGAQKTDLNLVVGRPGLGKTSLMLQLARHAAKYRVANKTEVRKNHVVFFTLEMPTDQLAMRMLAQMTGIDFSVIRSGKIPDNKRDEYFSALTELSELDIILDYKPAATPSYIRSRCETLAAQGRLDMVLVDSLNLMRSDVDFRGRIDLATDHNAQELKNIGGDFKIPVWAAHQMNRDVERRGLNSKPVLADLREGGEQPATGVIFIHHEFNNDSKTLITSSSLIVAKQRNGPTDEVPVSFVKALSRFENAYKVHA